MERTNNWIVVYDDGWEEVRVKIEADSSLCVALVDGAGPLEETFWKPTATVRQIRGWLESHKIDRYTYPQGRNTGAWEEALGKCSDRSSIKSLISSARAAKLSL